MKSKPVNETDPSAAGEITRWLMEWRGGDEEALLRLTTEVYKELRRLANSILGWSASNQTIQPTALVHELYLHLPGVQDIDWQSRAQFLTVAAKMMRNILVDHARKRVAAKRGGGAVAPLTIDVPFDDPALQVDVLQVHMALDRFAGEYPRQARVVELRYFGGLTSLETSEVLTATGIESSLRTVERDWTFARAWLENAIAS